MEKVVQLSDKPDVAPLFYSIEVKLISPEERVTV